MKKTILTFLTILFLASCSIEDQIKDDGKTYYRFSSSDYNLMIKYNYYPNQIITFQNQFGEQLHFKVISNTLEKSGMYSSSFAYPSSLLEYYYDNKSIRLKIVENNTNNYEDYLVIYHFSISEGVFKNGINLPIWNVFDPSFIDELQNPVDIYLRNFNNSFRNQLNINGHLFNKVVMINSNSNTISTSFSGGILERNVNKIYYDYDFGIIQFDDVNGKQWKVLYP